tara:strand:+ start:217 stop:1965 length:1749 start_codon:yes stop_codon:yes gene_type:complete
MIKEFAFGLSKRHYFQDAKELSSWQKLNNDTYMSLYDYDEYVAEYFAKNNKLSGFDGMIYIPDEFILDVDGNTIDEARKKTIGLTILLKDLDVPYKLYFSGTGFHVNIPETSFRWKPDKNLHLKVKDSLTKAGIFEYADPSVTDKTRLIRITNTRNSKSGLYKVAIKEEWLFDSVEIEVIVEHARRPRDDFDTVLESHPVFDVLQRQDSKIQVKEIQQFNNTARIPDPVYYTCIQKMLSHTEIGKRHMTALRIASHLRWRYPENVVRMIMEDWRQRFDRPDSKFTKNEMDSLVEGCYTGHNGSGYRYGCNDSIMDSFCSDMCSLYKTKKSISLMDATAMEKTLMEFITNNQDPINIGKLYGQNFPVYPGEVVIIQAPPKSMKTMLMQNWMNSFKKESYFIEMEMSPRQIWSRFVMIENNWNEEQLLNHYKQYRNGMEEKFKWLTVDYNAPYANELDKRVSMLPRKPEIIVVDHMGLFKSNHKDNNMKGEEVSQSIMEIAVKHNIIVFAVSEITKQAFHEGMNISSSKGSFRTAYNANKVLSLSPLKDSDGLIKMLHLKCEANRERENLNVKLKVNNVNIGVV